MAVSSPALAPDSILADLSPRTTPKSWTSDGTLLWFALLIPAILLVHGYHPYSEDAGIYVAGVRKLADPSVYKPDAAFVLANTHLSLFAHLLAAILHVTRIPLSYLLLLTHLASIFAFVLASRMLALRIFTSSAAQWSAVVLAGACFTLPVAGTSLLLMDPYVTARSFSTPLGIFALAAAIDHRWTRAALFLLLTALMHPLMFVYVAVFVLLFVLIDLDHARVAWAFSLIGVLASGAIYLATLGSTESAAYRQAVLSRSYLFPSQWAWFEHLGLFLPLFLFAIPVLRRGSYSLPGKLCLVATMLGASAAFSAFLFVHPSGPYSLARLQLLRSFHMLYLVGIILLGGLIGEHLIGGSGQKQRRPAARWTGFALLFTAGAFSYAAQRHTYLLSAHIEFPRVAPRNPWEQTFLWIRSSTPVNAVFAAEPDLVLVRGEEGQGFRVITGRSLLADYKDEGVVVVFPRLATQWAFEHNAQDGLNQLTDAERVSRLQPLGVTWLLLSSSAVTSLRCPYRNRVSQVCELTPARQSSLSRMVLEPSGRVPAAALSSR